ncbi:TIGR03619 family F420-dependent LLM class oxidoreductase [Planotetraspora phitsanulokensis]|uniref:LLM class F420-dependent oxidoreductase n=1 Tax=Planotetraspora phitsanulokensis TaxID=575192 RepID=A0A8J3XIM8_9ACTN|nr:TIGR03619 family F420-dependent LLM class oxidoreductase [Planotetraspora phitsanulokensis]GII42305.1 LLM class F420-dependent oxidoreductase [Planotetraspora phitsanulokensis]
MKIGFAVPVSGSWATPDNMKRIAARAEDLGYSGLWTFQRLLHPAENPLAPAYRSVQDPTVVLSFLAGITERIRLGVAIVNLPFYSPALLAKQLATLQIVSGGRLDAGFGLGWLPEEFAASGVSIERRGKRGEEAIELIRRLWTEDLVQHEGEFYEVPPANQDPKPSTLPAILLGGTAPVALRRVGRLADGWISSSRADLSKIDEQISIVKESAQEAGRDPGTLRFIVRGVTQPGKEAAGPLVGPYAKIREDIDDLAAKGVTEVFHDFNFNPEFGNPLADPVEAMRRAEEALEELAPSS